MNALEIPGCKLLMTRSYETGRACVIGCGRIAPRCEFIKGCFKLRPFGKKNRTRISCIVAAPWRKRRLCSKSVTTCLEFLSASSYLPAKSLSKRKIILRLFGGGSSEGELLVSSLSSFLCMSSMRHNDKEIWRQFLD